MSKIEVSVNHFSWFPNLDLVDESITKNIPTFNDGSPAPLIHKKPRAQYDDERGTARDENGNETAAAAAAAAEIHRNIDIDATVNSNNINSASANFVRGRNSSMVKFVQTTYLSRNDTYSIYSEQPNLASSEIELGDILVNILPSLLSKGIETVEKIIDLPKSSGSKFDLFFVADHVSSASAKVKISHNVDNLLFDPPRDLMIDLIDEPGEIDKLTLGGSGKEVCQPRI